MSAVTEAPQIPDAIVVLEAWVSAGLSTATGTLREDGLSWAEAWERLGAELVAQHGRAGWLLAASIAQGTTAIPLNVRFAVNPHMSSDGWAWRAFHGACDVLGDSKLMTSANVDAARELLKEDSAFDSKLDLLMDAREERLFWLWLVARHELQGADAETAELMAALMAALPSDDPRWLPL